MSPIMMYFEQIQEFTVKPQRDRDASKKTPQHFFFELKSGKNLNLKNYCFELKF